MEESALDRYFDKYIANDASHTEEDEEKNLDQDEELFFKLLPDELFTLMESSHYPIPRSLDSTGQKLIPKITNITSTVDLGCELDLAYIAANAWNVEFNRKRFNGLTMMIRKPKATGSFFSTGKLVCLGADSVENSRIGARRLARIVQKLGFPVRFLKFKVHNLVASCKTYPVSLEQMAVHKKCSFEPELFPAIFYSVLPGMTMTVTRMGTVYLCGAKSQADIDKAFEIAQPILNFYRK